MGYKTHYAKQIKLYLLVKKDKILKQDGHDGPYNCSPEAFD
jgi:hypothetical protein